jgi:hypothetical protein
MTPNLGTTPQQNLSITTTTNPGPCLHTLTNARAHDNRGRQPNPPEPTVNEKEGKLEMTFLTKTNDIWQNSCYTKKKSNTTFFSCYFFFPGQFVIYSVHLFFQAEDILYIFFEKRFKLDELFVCYLVFYFYTRPDTALTSSCVIHESHFDMFFSSFHWLYGTLNSR